MSVTDYLLKNLPYPNMQIVLPSVYLLMVYMSTHLRRTAAHYFTANITLILVAFTTQSMGLLVGALAPTPQIATSLLPGFLLPFTLMSGFLANRGRIVPYWYWLERISFLAYGCVSARSLAAYVLTVWVAFDS